MSIKSKNGFTKLGNPNIYSTQYCMEPPKPRIKIHEETIKKCNKSKKVNLRGM